MNRSIPALVIISVAALLPGNGDTRHGNKHAEHGKAGHTFTATHTSADTVVFGTSEDTTTRKPVTSTANPRPVTSTSTAL